MASIILLAVHWGIRVKAADANGLNMLISKACYVLGIELKSLVEVLVRGGC